MTSALIVGEGWVFWLIALIILVLLTSARMRERVIVVILSVCLSVCHALISEITDNLLLI